MLVIHDLAEPAGDAVEDNDRAGTARIGGGQQVTKTACASVFGIIKKQLDGAVGRQG